ncbi:DUF1684 domain-containing protein (plasmid) [Deinococcus sp. KNUC1210]|uniref:DUF1684 domain-containing protein n=1 Tax=Deinococcus sp. KNUC1210 TaxID=2917691 RepID=UPI001EF0CBD8|nr:DUF1684 domain-containing protein [Deinococcus sp. KNUC1210]ULH17232.1 DUF1684 domain-containing protein [Deinococcus sp. KNUC1210]
MSESLLTLLDWRRRLNDLYAEVRRLRRGDPQAAHAHWQEVRNELFARHPQTPLTPEARAAFTALPVWPYDPAYAFCARVQTDLPTEQFVVQTSAGHDMPLTRVGRVALRNEHHDLGTLDAYWIAVYGGGLFVPFRDGGSGRSSYGGGRYLLDTVKSADLGNSPGGELLLDFNFAYHPSCYYDPQWSCPLAPPQNHLNAEVRAGERSAEQHA